MGCEAHCKWVKDMMALYDGIEFLKPDGSFDIMTNVQRMGAAMVLHGLKVEGGKRKEVQYIEEWGLRVYTHDYFSPITSTHVMRKTKNTYSIHYLEGSWMEGNRRKGWRNWVITREAINALVQIKRFITRNV